MQSRQEDLCRIYVTVPFYTQKGSVYTLLYLVLEPISQGIQKWQHCPFSLLIGGTCSKKPLVPRVRHYLGKVKRDGISPLPVRIGGLYNSIGHRECGIKMVSHLLIRLTF